MEKKITEQLMNLLGLKETLDKFEKASRVRWYGHMLRKVGER